MLYIWIYSLISVLIVSLISFIGIVTLSLDENKIRNYLLYFVSFAAGALFGDVFIHLIPEIVREYGFGLRIGSSLLLGIILFFIIEKFIHWRHCHAPESKGHIHTFAILNLIGDGVHNFIDGLVIGASYLTSIPVGIATTIAVVLHEIPQEIGDFSVLIHGGFTKGKALFVNFLTALTAFLGVIIALLINNYIQGTSKFLLPLAAGGFIYIAGTDLIPELHKEVKISRSLIQLLAFILGIILMILLVFIE